MQYNRKMKKYVRKAKKRAFIHFKRDLIEKRYNLYHEEYYCFKDNFCLEYDAEKLNIRGNRLSDFEWEGNELYISNHHFDNNIIVRGIFLVLNIRKELKRKYRGVPFDIILMADTNKLGFVTSIQIRFYKVRENQSIISRNDLEKCKQPILISHIVPLINNR